MQKASFSHDAAHLCFSANGTQQDLSVGDGGAAEHTDLSASQELAPEPEEDQEPEIPPPTAVS